MNLPKKICLLDDDPVFGQILLTLSSEHRIQLDYFESLEDLGRIARLIDYDLLICDYFLDRFTGAEVANYVKSFFCNVPMMIVSSVEDVEANFDDWPRCVRGFYCKTSSPSFILSEAHRLAALGLEGDQVFEQEKEGLSFWKADLL